MLRIGSEVRPFSSSPVDPPPRSRHRKLTPPHRNTRTYATKRCLSHFLSVSGDTDAGTAINRYYTVKRMVELSELSSSEAEQLLRERDWDLATTLDAFWSNDDDVVVISTSLSQQEDSLVDRVKKRKRARALPGDIFSPAEPSAADASSRTASSPLISPTAATWLYEIHRNHALRFERHVSFMHDLIDRYERVRYPPVPSTTRLRGRPTGKLKHDHRQGVRCPACARQRRRR